MNRLDQVQEYLENNQGKNPVVIFRNGVCVPYNGQHHNDENQDEHFFFIYKRKWLVDVVNWIETDNYGDFIAESNWQHWYSVPWIRNIGEFSLDFFTSIPFAITLLEKLCGNNEQASTKVDEVPDSYVTQLITYLSLPQKRFLVHPGYEHICMLPVDAVHVYLTTHPEFSDPMALTYVLHQDDVILDAVYLTDEVLGELVNHPIGHRQHVLWELSPANRQAIFDALHYLNEEDDTEVAGTSMLFLSFYEQQYRDIASFQQMLEAGEIGLVEVDGDLAHFENVIERYKTEAEVLGKFTTKTTCTNPRTPIDFESVDTAAISFVKGEQKICFTVNEVKESLRHNGYKRFHELMPLHLTEPQLQQLRFIAKYNLKDRELYDIVSNCIARYNPLVVREEIFRSTDPVVLQQLQTVELPLLFDLAMYCRRWKGGNDPLPRTERETLRYFSNAEIEQMYSTIRNLYQELSSYRILRELPCVNHGRFNLVNGAPQTIGARMDIMIEGLQPISCIRLTSNVLLENFWFWSGLDTYRGTSPNSFDFIG